MAADCFIGGIALFVRHVTGVSTGILEGVTLCRPQPSSSRLANAYEDFFEVPVQFAAQDNSIRLRSGAMNMPLITQDVALQAILEPHAVEQLAANRTEKQCFEEDAAEALKLLLHHGVPSRSNLAEALGLSERSLRREFATSGLSYRQLLHDVRLAEAKALLVGSQLSMESLSARLGFADAHSLSRWFSAQEGLAPSVYRKKSK